MCGRFVRYVSIPEIANEFDADHSGLHIRQSYNIPPGQDIAVIIGDRRNRLILCKWGFIPSWAKDPSIGNRMINARAESVAEKPAFRSAFRKQRCLVAANGFYEWKKEGKAKTPIYIYLKPRRIFGFAGLYNVWISPEGKEICTATIITTGANKILDQIHDRMPVIIPKGKETVWLDRSVQDKEALITVLNPYPSEEMEMAEVSALVNSPKNDSPDCINPVR